MLNVVLNETEIINNALNGIYNKNQIMIVLKLLMKYYYLKGITDKLELKEKLFDFLKNNYEDFKRPRWEDNISKMIQRFLNLTKKKKIEPRIIDIKEISITKAELENIQALNDIKLEKIAFIMLVYAKISNIMMNNEDGWINKSCSVICKEAKVNLKGIEKEKEFHKLYEKGYIQQRKNNAKTNMKVCYINEDSEVEMIVNDFDNVVYKYILWRNKDMMACYNCGKPIKITTTNNKYCNSCAKEIKKEQTREIARESMRKLRENRRVKKASEIR